MSAQKKSADLGSTEERIWPLWEGVRRGPTFEELAEVYNISPDEQLAGVVGGWPEEERDDGFEEAVLRWRQQGLQAFDPPEVPDIPGDHREAVRERHGPIRTSSSSIVSPLVSKMRSRTWREGRFRRSSPKERWCPADSRSPRRRPLAGGRGFSQHSRPVLETAFHDLLNR